MATPVPVPGTTWETTGTPSAVITATDSTQDGATKIGMPADAADRDAAPAGQHPERGCRPARRARRVTLAG